MGPHEFFSLWNSRPSTDIEHHNKCMVLLKKELQKLIDYWVPAIEHIRRYLEGKEKA